MSNWETFEEFQEGIIRYAEIAEEIIQEQETQIESLSDDLQDTTPSG